MKENAWLRLMIISSILAIVSLACSFDASPGEIKETTDALATGIGDVQSVIGTGQALATELGESGIKETLQAAGTQIAASGVKETAQAIPTELAEIGAQATFEALRTEIAESGAKQTLQAVATDLPSVLGDKPEDIPVLGDGNSDLIATNSLISYFSIGSFQEVVEFYEREMPLQGWNRIEGKVSNEDSLAVLVFFKEGRQATVTIKGIPLVNQVSVIISIKNP